LSTKKSRGNACPLWQGLRKENFMAKTNNEILLEYLQAGNIVTTRNAPDELGIADVRANIRDLRDLGYEILDRWVSGTNRRGRKTTYKEYFLSNVNN
jgi:hypothetical protein